MEPVLTDTPAGLSVLGALIASLFAVLGVGIGMSLRPSLLRRTDLLTRVGHLLLRLSLFAALMVLVTYGAILVFYVSALPPWHPVKYYAGFVGAGVVWVGGVGLLFRALFVVDDP